MVGRPRKDPESARAPTHARGKLPNAEVQALADLALLGWETGLPRELADSLGGTWTFLAVRDPEAALELTRAIPDALPRTTRVSQRELGTDHAREVMASMVLALAEPVV